MEKTEVKTQKELVEVKNQNELNEAIAKHNGGLHILVNEWNDEDLIISGNVAGTVYIYGDVAGTVFIYGNVEGSVDIHGNVAGSVEIYGSIAGRLKITGNVAGSVEISSSAKVGSVYISGSAKVDIVEISGSIAGYKVNSPKQEKDLLLKIKEIILKNPELLKMDSWHCGTTHCLGGYAIILDERGKEIESATHSSIAATVLLPSSSKYLYKSKEEVIEYLNAIN